MGHQAHYSEQLYQKYMINLQRFLLDLAMTKSVYVSCFQIDVYNQNFSLSWLNHQSTNEHKCVLLRSDG